MSEYRFRLIDRGKVKKEKIFEFPNHQLMLSEQFSIEMDPCVQAAGGGDVCWLEASLVV